jgi:hypothetical protein
MAELDSQRQQDELLATVKSVAPAATDEVLVAAAKLGDHPAFVELCRRHSNTAFKMAYRITGNRDDAEDAIQDAWMRALQLDPRFAWMEALSSREKSATRRYCRTHPGQGGSGNGYCYG